MQGSGSISTSNLSETPIEDFKDPIFVSDKEGNSFEIGLLLGKGVEGMTFRTTVRAVGDKAKNLKLGQELALKKQPKSADEDKAKALQREIENSKKEGATILSIEPEEEDKDQNIYFIQSLFHGKDLRKTLYYINNEGEIEGRNPIILTKEEKDSIAYGLLREIEALHQLGIVHADVKPDNILYDARTRTVKLIDLGNSFKMEEGSPHDVYYAPGAYYASPYERENGHTVKDSFKSDNYAIGIIIASLYSNACYEHDALKVKQWSNARIVQALLADVIGDNANKPNDMPEDLFNIVRNITQYALEDRPESILFAHGLSQSKELHDFKNMMIHYHAIAEGLKKQISEDKQLRSFFKKKKYFRNAKDEVLQILARHQDLQTIRIELLNLKGKYNENKKFCNYLDNMANIIDSMCMMNARKIQSVRAKTIEGAPPLEKKFDYGLTIERICNRLNSLAKEFKETKTEMVFSNARESMPLTQAGKLIKRTRKAINSNQRSAMVENTLLQLKEEIQNAGLEAMGLNEDKKSELFLPRKAKLIEDIDKLIEELNKVEKAPHLKNRSIRV